MKRNLKAILVSAMLASFAAGGLAGCTQEHVHNYGEAVEWTWNADHTKATATLTCDGCAAGTENKTLTAEATGEAIVSTPVDNAGCADDAIQYVATVQLNGKTYTDTDSVAVAHTHEYDYTNIVWTWNADHTEATATVGCVSDSNSKHSIPTTAIEKEETAATLGQKGSATYTATISVDGTTYTSPAETVEVKYEVALPTLAAATYDGTAKTATVAADAPYTIKTNAIDAVNAGEYDVVLELKDTENNKWAGTDSTTVTVKFTVNGAANAVSAPTVVPDDLDIPCYCGALPTLSGATATYGEVSYVYSKTADGEFVPMTALTAEAGEETTTYYVKAVVAAAGNYAGAVSDAVAFEVVHAPTQWNHDDAAYSYAHCSCGYDFAKEIRFNKTVSGARQEMDASVASSAVVLTGVDYVSVVSIKLGDIDLGTDLAAIDFKTNVPDKKMHGEQTLSVVVTFEGVFDEEQTATVSVPVLIVTAYISTGAELYHAVYPCVYTDAAEPESADDKYDTTVVEKYGYYKLTATVDYREGEMKKVDPTCFLTAGKPYSNNLDGSYKASEHGGFFGGVLDGDGHQINMSYSSYGMFNALKGATIKNVVLNDMYYYGSLNWAVVLGHTVENTTLEDVQYKVSYARETAYEDIGNNCGMFAANKFTGNTWKNVTIDLSHASATNGLKLGSLFGSGMDDSNTFENCQLLNCGGLKEFGHNGGAEFTTVYNSIEGLEAYVAVSIDAEWNPGIGLESTEYQLFLTNPTESEDPIPAGAVITSVKLGDTEIAHTNLVINPSEAFTLADVGTRVLTVEVTVNGVVHYTYSVPVSIETEIQILEKTYAGAPKQLVLSSANGARLDVAGIEELVGYTIQGINYGAYALGANPAALTVPSELLADTQSHGENVQITIVAQSETSALTLTVPVTMITKEITTADEFNTVFVYPAAAAFYGYYTLGNNVGADDWKFTTNDRGSANCEYKTNGFRGTFNGNGYTITGNSWGGGLFGWIGVGAVIKNVKIVDKGQAGLNNRAIFAQTIADATLEDITITVAPTYAVTVPTENQQTNGLLANQWSYGTTLKNVTIDAGSNDLYALFGSGWYSGYEHSGTDKPTPTVSNNVYENVTIIANSLQYVGYWYDSYNDAEAKEDRYGVFNGVTVADEVASGAGIVFNSKATLAETVEIKMTEQTTTLQLGGAYADMTIVSVHHGADLLSNSATFSNDAFTTLGATTLTVVVKATNDNGGAVQLTLTVPATVVSGYQQVTLAGDRQDVILSGTTYALDLREYATGYTVQSISTDKYNLGTNPAALDVTALKADPQSHGVQNITVNLSGGAGTIELTVPVTIVTRAFSSVTDFQYRNTTTQTSWTGENPFKFHKVMYGYYILSNDIGYYSSGGNFEAVAFGNTVATKTETYWNNETGFAGTFDGRGHTIAGLTYGSFGLFACIGKGAVIKDTTFLLGQYNAASAQGVSVLAYSITDATIENVTVRVHTMMGDATTATQSSVGLLCYTGAYRNTFKNLQIISETVYNCTGIIGGIFGYGGYGFHANGGNTFENCSIKAIGLLSLGGNPTLGVVAPDAFADKGLTVTLTGANA